MGSAERFELHIRQYRFGDYTLDLDSGFLLRGGEEVALRAKSFEVLTYLVERHGRLVTKTELIEGVWRDAAVTDNSLAQCLVEIRRALDDDAQELVRTVARRGYLFVAPVTTPPREFPRNSGEAAPMLAPAPSKRLNWRILAVAILLPVLGRRQHPSPDHAAARHQGTGRLYPGHQLHGLRRRSGIVARRTNGCILSK